VNQKEIVDQARALGIVVWVLADLGGEVLDLLACWQGVCIPMEVKPPGLEDDLTDGERKGIAELERVGAPWAVITSLDDMLEAFSRYASS